jgi:hypothetical protein
LEIMAAGERNASDDAGSRKVIIVVAVIAAVLIAGLFYLLLKAGSGGTGSAPPRLGARAIRAGSPDWEKFGKLIVLDPPEADESKRALGDIVMTLQTTVRNFTGKTLDGLEVRAAVVDHQGKAVKERTVVAIPTRQAELGPNKTLSVSVLLDGMSDTDDRADIKMEVTAFRFK